MSEQADVLFRAVADETRRAIFMALMRSPGLSTTQLVASTQGMTRWGVMKHIAVLREAGLIQTMTEGRQRRHYPEPSALGVLRRWLDEASSATR